MQQCVLPNRKGVVKACGGGRVFFNQGQTGVGGGGGWGTAQGNPTATCPQSKAVHLANQMLGVNQRGKYRATMSNVW